MTRLPKVDKIGVNNSYCPDWSKAGDSHYIMYVNALDDALARVNIPAALFGVDVAVETSHLLIDRYYNAVLSCVTNCCNNTIPLKKFEFFLLNHFHQHAIDIRQFAICYIYTAYAIRITR